jgi:AraC-like DNA-binding protein
MGAGSLSQASPAMLISSLHLRALADTLDMVGVPSDAVIKDAGLPALASVGDSQWVPQEWFDRFMCASMAATNDPGFGLRACTSLAVMRHGFSALLVMHSASLRQSLDDIQRYLPLYLERPELTMTERDGLLRIEIDPIGVSEPGRRFRADYLVLGLLQMMRFAGARDDDITKVCFKHEAPAYADRCRELIGPLVTFGQATTEIQLASHVLDRPLSSRNDAMYGMLKARAEMALASVSSRRDLLTRVRSVLHQSLHEAPTMAMVARHLKVSDRTLRRQLAELDVSFQDLLAECQRDVAMAMLASGEHCIKQVASATGFSSPSCFHRAFRRWTGDTPQAWACGLVKRSTRPGEPPRIHA